MGCLSRGRGQGRRPTRSLCSANRCTDIPHRWFSEPRRALLVERVVPSLLRHGDGAGGGISAGTSTGQALLTKSACVTSKQRGFLLAAALGGHDGIAVMLS